MLGQENCPDAGSLHAVAEAAALLGDSALRDWAHVKAAQAREDPFSALVTGARLQWRESKAERGHARMQQHLLASLSAATDATAAQDLERFLAEELHGYMLTHQLYAAHWAQERGWQPSEPARVRIQSLVGKLAAEAAMARAFSDLLVEQLQLLERFGESTDEALLKTILDAQGRDGSFRDATEWNLLYDGEAVAMQSHPVHTTAQALLLCARVKVRTGSR
jgi:hypothetical protein